MIPDFQELSDKIDQLAELTHALRRENAQLRQANSALVVENMGYQRKLGSVRACGRPAGADSCARGGDQPRATACQ
jgi:regulator of replication initiation timing